MVIEAAYKLTFTEADAHANAFDQHGTVRRQAFYASRKRNAEFENLIWLPPTL